jgi:Zn finger protein HypA/HybF involved in hydrogenase expression
MAAEGGNTMAKLEYDGIDEVISVLENEPFDCTCSICGKTFQATQEQLLQPTVTCPHCGAQLEEV